ncbi:MAG: ACT domain-containing protein [Actinobacteria bacterium]|nr:ACT domain-containing protein [Actinomycetota bacterium]
MASDLAIHLDDQPGELARLGQVLGEAGVNIEGFCAVTSGGGQAEIHVLVDDPTPAFDALTAAGIEIASEQEVAVVDVEDTPGVLGEVSRKLGDAGVNLTLAYMATSTRLVFAADDLAQVKTALD